MVLPDKFIECCWANAFGKRGGSKLCDGFFKAMLLVKQLQGKAFRMLDARFWMLDYAVDTRWLF